MSSLRLSHLPPSRYIGLDAEALWWEEGSLPYSKLALCFSFGTLDGIGTIEASVPGKFDPGDVAMLKQELSAPDVVIVGHNALRYDLPLLNGVCIEHGLAALPEVKTVDTMGVMKTGRAFRNTLRAQCERYGITLKQDSPNWRKIIQGDQKEWELMVEYCENDVKCALELRLALQKDGVPPPMKVWKPERGIRG